MINRSCQASVVVFCILALGHATVYAGKPMPKDGKFLGRQGDFLAMQTGDGQMWKVSIPEIGWRTTYSNTADVRFLKPGMAVSLRGMFDRRGRGVKVFESIKVFTPEGPQSLGAEPQGESAAALIAQAADPKSKPLDPDQPLEYEVRGIIRRIAKNGELSIDAGTTKVVAKVDASTLVNVEITPLDMARPGDDVTVRAYYDNVGEAKGFEMRIRGAEPFGDPQPAARTDDAGQLSVPATEPIAPTPGFGPRPGEAPAADASAPGDSPFQLK